MTRLLLLAGLLLLLLPAAAGAAEREVAWSPTLDPYVPRYDEYTIDLSVYVDDCGTNSDQQRVAVERTAERVVITVFDQEPDAEVCPDIARRADLEVKLGGPLGRRAVVDGSDGRTIFTREQPLRWRLLGGDRPRPASRAVSITYPLCRDGREAVRWVVERTRSAVKITLLRRSVAGAPRCRHRVYSDIDLEGRLGRRALRDGSRP